MPGLISRDLPETSERISHYAMHLLAHNIIYDNIESNCTIMLYEVTYVTGGIPAAKCVSSISRYLLIFLQKSDLVTPRPY